MLPVTESIVMPEIVGEMVNVLTPVPLLALNDPDVRAVPKVVLIAEPLSITIAELTVMVIALVPITPIESVAVIVS